MLFCAQMSIYMYLCLPLASLKNSVLRARQLEGQTVAERQSGSQKRGSRLMQNQKMLHPSQGLAWRGSSRKSLAVLERKLLARQPLTGPLQPGHLLPPSVWNSLNLLVIRTQQKPSVRVNLTEKEFAGEVIFFYLFIPRWDMSLESAQHSHVTP